MRISRIGILALGLALCCGIARAETVEEVGKKIAAATEKLNSFSAKIKMTTDMKQEGFSMTSTTDGTMELLRKGSDLLIRTEQTTAAETNVGGNSTKQTSSTLMVSDGAFSYTLSDMAGTKSATKMKMEKPDHDPFNAWKDSADLKLLPDATVDGRQTWVIEVNPKSEQAGPGKTVVNYDKDSGQMIKMTVFAPDGKPMTTMTYSDIKVNGTISADRFVFKAPEGVEVQDMSK